MKIDSRHISVVVQGPIVGKPEDDVNVRHTFLCLESIRTCLSDAEIILSTWIGQNTGGLDFDLLVESEDPGGHVFHRTEKYYNNINRQILSTRNGLAKVTREYAIKIRSDMVLTGLGFMDFFDVYDQRDAKFSLLQKKVVIPSIYSRNPRRVFPFPFHPSDWFFFGRTEDVVAIWDVPLADEPFMSRWFEHHPRPKHDPYPFLLCRYLPEQYLWTSFLRKYLEIDFDYFCQTSRDVIVNSERSLVGNLVMGSPEQLNVQFLKYSHKFEDWISVYGHDEWRALYLRYCAGKEISAGREVLLKRLAVFVLPLKIGFALDCALRFALRVNGELLVRWKQRSPSSFDFFQKIFRALTQ